MTLSRLSQFSCHPTEGAEKALHQVLSYLNCTTDFALFGAGAPVAPTAAGVTNPTQQSLLKLKLLILLDSLQKKRTKLLGTLMHHKQIYLVALPELYLL